ncbi:Co/Zn/Cd efflux system component [Burkholderiales bacterium JOSHI_001]|nr:Co/Zn/Cd efflux system component [Burkholderiales bacterium JOSHI_001]
MSAHHDHSHDHHAHEPVAPTTPGVRRALWIALVLNAAMFGVEIASGISSGSVSLLADAIDFAGDAASYGLSLAVLSMAMVWRSRTALLKAASMGAFGVVVLGRALWLVWHGQPPQAMTMGLVGTLALAVNLGVAWLLYAFRNGDANLRSVWLCSRNDAIGNLAILAAAAGVFGTHQAWPDLVVAAIMAFLAISASLAVLRHAREELAQDRARA